MRKAANLSGMTFDRWYVLPTRKGYGSGIRWRCVCKCGTIKFVLASELKRGGSKSCGCLSKELSFMRMYIHGESRSREYNVWRHILYRCENKKYKEFEYYGGRGIFVCKRWHKFENFLSDMGRVPEKNLTIERIDNNGNYEPSNCIWATQEIQNRNKRIYKNNKTGIKGVHWAEQIKKYRVSISLNRKKINLGCYHFLSDAKEARTKGEIKYWGKVFI